MDIYDIALKLVLNDKKMIEKIVREYLWNMDKEILNFYLEEYYPYSLYDICKERGE